MFAGAIGGSAIGGRARAALDWWLRDALPPALRPRAAKRARTFVRLSSDALEVSDGGLEAAARFPPLEALDADAAGMLREALGDGAVEIGLAAQNILRLRFELPPGAGSHLHRAIGYQLATASPVDPAALLYAARPLRPTRRSEPVEAEAIMARKADIAALQARWAVLELPPATIGCAHPDEPRLEVAFEAPDSGRRTGSSGALVLTGLCLGLLTLAPVMLAAALTVVETSRRAEADALARELRPRLSARRDAADAAALAQAAKPHLHSIGPGALVAELTRILPEGGWISDMALDARELKFTIRGNAQAGFEALVRAPRFRAAHVLPGATRDAIGVAVPRDQLARP